MELVVKVATNEKELQDAFYVRKTVFVEEQNVPTEREQDEYESESAHFVLYENGEPVGAGRFRTIGNVGKVERICVLKEKRNHGYGKIMMEKIEQYAKEHGVPKLKLNAQLQAIPFYLRIGYKEETGEVFLDAGIPHKTMVKELE